MNASVENPHFCNTGVQSYNNEKSYSIDWLRFTTGKIKFNDCYPKNISIPLINELLKVLKSDFSYDELDVQLGGFYGYRSRMVVSEGITIYFCGSPNKYGELTSMIEITGTGCDKFNSIDDWFELITFILSDSLDGKSTRIDLAIDDFYGKEISSKKFFDVIKGNFFKRSGSPKSKIEWIINDWNDYDLGTTVNFYSKSSNIQLCVYNKKAETKAKKNLEINTPQWIRYEMRFYEDQADKQLRFFYNCLLNEKFEKNNCKSISQFLSNSLYELLKLYKPCNDSNMSRWVELTEWKDFISDIGMINFDRRKTKISELLKTKIYFENSYSRFLSKMLLLLGEEYFLLWLKNMIFIKRDSLEPKDLVSVNELRIKLGFDKLSKQDFINNIESLRILNKDDLFVLKNNEILLNELEESENKFLNILENYDIAKEKRKEEIELKIWELQKIIKEL